ncbi:MAG: polymer-forming cytoskeletal protein [Brevundimonas sp.]|uniref:bactofilin family protein n=1 Tax=Brevundimonas sp. TaxID=1871086 RepID=UPI002ABBBC09|nr:polymer-forming cytoskeletal protein [Brevundimonas sp.]MDZ4110002.1 polymer-forming cytoskeletal protein [Brevundimonas sp.]
MFNKSKSPAKPSSVPSIPPLPDMPQAPQAPQASHAPSAQPRQPAPPQASGRNLSTLSADLQFEGNISGSGDLQVDGQIKGDVKVGRLIVGETGAIEGGVNADYVEVRGRIVGAVSGKQVKLVSTAYVDGDITAEQLSIDIGAYFQGRCIQGSRNAAPAPAPRPAQPQVVAQAPQPAAPSAPQQIDMSSN